MRKSEIIKLQDSCGIYEQEIFHAENPKVVIIGIHGNGVRRWDGEKFFYQVAEYFTDSIVVLVDQNQLEADGCRLNSVDIMAERNQKALAEARRQFPDLPVWLVAHSMGCGITSLMDVSGVDGIVFVAPGVGNQVEKYIKRYGADIVEGKVITSSDGLYKNISKEFMDSVAGINWQEKYASLIKKHANVHVFESGADEIVDEERFELRNMPFASYAIINGAKHNFAGKYSAELFSKIEKLL